MIVVWSLCSGVMAPRAMLYIAAGPAHAPHFECTVKVRGWEFSGTGSTKKQAKTAAAEAALKYLHGVHSVDAITGKDPALLGDNDPLKMGKVAGVCKGVWQGQGLAGVVRLSY